MIIARHKWRNIYSGFVEKNIEGENNLKIWNHYELEALFKDSKEFIPFLNEFMQNNSLEDTLEIVRVSGVCFNIYNNRQKISKKVISNIKAVYKSDIKLIDKFEEKINIINSIFKDFYKLRSSRKLDQIPQKREVITFILSLEIMLGSLIEYINGNSIHRIKEVYPYVISLFDEGKQKILPAQKDINRVLGIADSIAEFAGSLLKSMGGGKGNIGKLETMRMSHIRVAREHIELFDLWSSLLNIEQKWRFIGTDFDIDNKKIHIQPKNEDFLHAQEISKVRFKDQRSKWYTDFNLADKTELERKIDQNAKKLPPAHYLCENEAYYCIAIGEFLHTHDLNIRLLGVSLAEWIRAYVVIQIEAENYLKERFESKVVKPLNLNNWTIMKTETYWINLFVSKGVSQASALKIINNFKFNQDAKDLLDCPFVVHNDSLIIIPSVASHIDPSMSLISLLNKKKVDISFKGTGLEEYILNKLNKLDIGAKRLKRIVNGETYECDVVFTIDNDLFFVELKAFGQPLTIREYYNFLIKIIQRETEKINKSHKERSAVEQLNRIVDYYVENINIVREELKLEEEWHPKNIYKVIVTTAMLGESMYYNDCYIADTSAFVRFLDRNPPGFSIGNRSLKPYHEDFEGNITSEKLINMLKNPPQIELGNIRVKKNYRNLAINDLTVQYPYYNDQLGDFIEYDKELLQRLGLEKDEIKKD